MKSKRVLSLILALSMLISCLCITAFAEERNKLTVLSVNKIDETSCTVGEKVTSVNAGDVIAVSLGIKAGSEKIGVSGYQLEMCYDRNVLELWSQTSNEDGSADFYDSSVSVVNAKRAIKNWGNPTVGAGTVGRINLSVTNVKSTTDYTKLNCPVNADDSAAFAQVAFKVKSDVESCTTEFNFTKAESKVIYYSSASDSKTSLLDIDCVTTRLTVNGVTPTIKTVSLDESSVIVNGTDSATVKATATSAKGTDITNSVAWSVSGGNDVSISQDGTITVDAKAQAGTYTITASAKDGSSQGSADNKLTVTRAPAKAATITLTRHWTDLVVPYNGQSGAGFLATVKDQYGDEMKNAEVKWSITPQVDGVSINENSGEITVLTKAKDTIANTTGTTFTVTATCGDAKKIEKFTVKRAAAEAKTITISGADAVTIPTGDTATTKNYTAEVKDQYDSPMAAQNVEWSVSQATGVSMTTNGNLTVDNTAQAGDVTVTATVKGSTDVTARKTVKLQSVVFTQTAAPTVKENPTYGDTWSTIVTRIGSYSAKVGDTVIEGTYSLKDADARPDAGKQTYTILFNSNDGTYKDIVVATGEVTVQPYTLTVTKGDIDASKTYDGTTAVTADKVTGKLDYTNPSFGDELSITYTNATFDNANVASASKVTFSGLKLEGAKAANYKLNVDLFEVDAKISKASLTIKANDNTITYGDAPAENGFTVVSGLCGNDTDGVVTNVTYTYDYTQNGNVGSYTITPAGGTADNYEVTGYEIGTLTVNPKALSADAITAIGTVTYNGTAQTPGVTVKDGDKPLVSGTDYTAAYSNNTNAGTAKVVITGKGNYSGSVEKTFTIATKEITVSGIIAVGRAYNGETTVDLDYTNVVFTGKIEGDTLTITATGTMADANVGTDKNVTISNLTLGGASKDNYALAADGQQTATKVTITKQPATPLSLTAKNAVYTGQPYAEENVTPSRNADEVRLTYYKDNNGAKGDTLNSAPANVGVYWVSGKIEESSNISEAVASAAKFQITKAPLTIKANDKTITYGEAPTNGGAEYTGLVNGENKDVVSGLTYAYNYTQYGNVGTYTITPKDATAANYDIKFVSGKLTVSPKTVGLDWTGAGTLYYDGKAKNVTATATGLENNDAITVTVAGGKQTDIGSYSAAATGLTGAKAGNYKLPAGKTQEYTIEAALTSVTVTPSTITATIDGLTIKLVGYKNANEEITVNGTTEDKLTVNGVEYTIDDSAVVVKSAEVNVKPSETETAEAHGADDTITDEVLNAINVAGTKGEGLEKAAASLIESISEGKPEGTRSIEVTFVLKIQPKTYKDGKLTLVIEPYIKRAFRDENGTQIGETQETKISNSELKSLITVSVKLPGDMATTNLFAKHTLGNGKFEYLTVTVANGVATWQQSSFSEVTLVSDIRTATITFKKDDDSTITKTYTAANLGEAFPTDSKSGYTYNGWTVGDKTYKTLTDEALTAMDALTDDARTLTASFTQNGGGSIGGGGGGGGAATYPVSVDKAENGTVTVSPKNAAKGGTVTVEVKPDEGYELASVTVLDKDGKKLDVTLKNGKYSFVMPDGKVSIKAEFAKKGAMSFADVAANSWYYDAVKYCFDNGLMNGVGEDKFAPSATTTRAMIWTVLARDAGVDTSTGATWYEAGMKWAMENKISDGTGAENAITREQFATMLYRVAQSKGEGFSGSWYFPLSFDDAASISDWADEAMHWCVMKGILNGSNNKLNPTDNASRAEVAAMLMRFLTLDK